MPGAHVPVGTEPGGGQKRPGGGSCRSQTPSFLQGDSLSSEAHQRLRGGIEGLLGEPCP